MSLKTIFNDVSPYKVISSHDWNTLNESGVVGIETPEGDFNITVNNSDKHLPVISLNRHLILQSADVEDRVTTTNVITNNVDTTTITADTSVRTPHLVSDQITNNGIDIYNSLGATGYVLTSNGSTGTYWSLPTPVGELSNTDGNISIMGGDTSYVINLSNTIELGTVSCSNVGCDNVDASSIQAPTISVTAQYTLPQVSGTAGQVLQSNGDGTCGWTNPAVAGVSSLQNTDGNISVSDPTGDVTINLSQAVCAAVGIAGQYNIPTTAGNAGDILFANGDGTCSFVQQRNTDGNVSVSGDIINLSDNIAVVSSISIQGQYTLPTVNGPVGNFIMSNGDSTTQWLPLHNNDGNINIVNNNIDLSLTPTVQGLTVQGEYSIPTSNGGNGTFLMDNGDGTTQFIPLHNTDGNLSISLNNIDLSPDVSISESLSIGQSTGFAYTMPPSVQFATAGQVLTYTGFGNCNFQNPAPPPSQNYTYTNVAFSNGTDAYTIPSITMTNNLNGTVSYLFSFLSSTLYSASGNITVPFKSINPIDTGLYNPSMPITLQKVQGLQFNAVGMPPYTIDHEVDIIFSVDSSGYLYMSLTYGDIWSNNKAYCFSAVTLTNMSNPLSWQPSNVSGLYRTF